MVLVAIETGDDNEAFQRKAIYSMSVFIYVCGWRGLSQYLFQRSIAPVCGLQATQNATMTGVCKCIFILSDNGNKPLKTLNTHKTHALIKHAYSNKHFCTNGPYLACFYLSVCKETEGALNHSTCTKSS